MILDDARCELAQQIDRYRDRRGITCAVDLALRDTLTPTGLAPLAAHVVLVERLTEWLDFDGGDYGLRRAFDTYRLAVEAEHAGGGQ